MAPVTKKHLWNSYPIRSVWNARLAKGIGMKFARNSIVNCILSRRKANYQGGLGAYRMHLPYFKLPGGASLAFLRPSQQKHLVTLKKIGQGYCHLVEPFLTAGWKGMHIVGHGRLYGHYHRDLLHIRPSCVVEVDWNSAEAGRIGVTRDELQLTKKAKDSLRWLEERATELRRGFFKRNSKSIYTSLNARLVNVENMGSRLLNWIRFENVENKTEAIWGTLTPPFINALSFPYSRTDHLMIELNCQPVSIAASLGKPDDDEPHGGLAWCGASVPPDKVVARVAERGVYPSFGVSPLWADRVSQASSTHVAGLASPYPPEWEHLCGSSFEMYSGDDEGTTVWNQDNFLVRSVNAGGWQWCKQKFLESLDPLPHKASLLTDTGKAASWTLMCLKRQQSELWDGLKDRDPTFLRDLWIALFGAKTKNRIRRAVYQWVEHSARSRLRILTPEGWVAKAGEAKDLREFLPIPSPEWCVIVRDKRLSKH